MVDQASIPERILNSQATNEESGKKSAEGEKSISLSE